ncbi:hypothetical protein V8C86DRAFT_3141522 [Haematococcus lacustris]
MVLPAFMRIFKSSKTEEDVAASKAVDQPGVTAANKPPGLRYTVKDIPPAWVCVLLGFQHYLTFLGSTVLIPHLLVPAMGGNNEDMARVIQTIFFVSGINTLLQTTIGDRLPCPGRFLFLPQPRLLHHRPHCLHTDLLL